MRNFSKPTISGDPRITLASGVFAVASMSLAIIIIAVAILQYTNFPIKPTFIRGYPYPFPTINTGYSLWYQFISELGIGPSAFLFNVGMIITGILAIPIFPGLLRLLRSSVIAKIGIISGVIATISLIFIGYYPMAVSPLHDLFSIVFFVSIGIAIVLISWEMLKGSFFSKALVAYGIFFVIVDLIFIINGSPLAEWTVFIVIVTWVLIMGLEIVLKRNQIEI